MYELFDTRMKFPEALEFAATKTRNGWRGHLVTITSQAEQDAIQSAAGMCSSGHTWLGASDARTEGEWEGVTGPERLERFWSGTGATGSAVGGRFSAWVGAEPNNSGGEDCAEFYGSGSDIVWNDEGCTESNSVLIEYEPAWFTDGVLEYGGHFYELVGSGASPARTPQAAALATCLVRTVCRR